MCEHRRMAPGRTDAAALVRALPAPAVLLDDGGHVVELSDDAALALRCTRGDLVGAELAGHVGGAGGDRLRDALADLSRTREAAVRVPDPAGGGLSELHIRLAMSELGAMCVLERRRPTAEELLADVLAAVADTDVAADALSHALGRIGASNHWDLAALWVVDRGAGLLRPVATWARDEGDGEAHRERTLQVSLAADEGLPGRAWSSGTTLVDADPGEDRRLTDAGLLGTSVQHPIVSGGHVVGVIELLAAVVEDPRPWLESALRAVEPALAHLLERVRDRLAVGAAEGRLAAALDAGQFGVAGVDAGSGRVEWSSRMAALHGQTPVPGAGPLGALLASVHPDDLDEIERALRTLPEPTAGDPSPVHQIEYRVTDGGDLRWLSTRITATVLPSGQPQIAAITSDVTERKRVEQRTHRRAMAIEGLQWVSQAIIAGRELRDTAVAVSHAATGVLGAVYGIVLYRVPGDTADELAWALSGVPTDLEVPDPPTELELPDDLEAARGPALVDLRSQPDVRAFVLGLRLPVEVGTMRSALIVPIRGDGRDRLGTMVFLHPEAGYFNDDDVRLARSIGASTGVAIENAKHHEQQRLAAAAFQRELLPDSTASIEGADVCVRYHPGRDGIEVGGDWYDVIDLGDSRVGLAVGDVCGHGLTAAAHMGQFRHSFRALVQSSVSPEEALRVLNDLALDELRTTMTIAYVELDTTTGECRTWLCGHLPPLIAGEGGHAVRWLGEDVASGPMLGFLPGLQVSATHDVLRPGELLLIYSDGLVERRGESIDDGLDRLAASFVGRSADIESACDELYQLLADQGPAADDTALLAVRRH
jgi:PAS domain-containing protein/serine/threonine protein phosphatase PrpC